MWRWRRWLFIPVVVVLAVAAVGMYQLTRIPLPAAHRLAQTTFIYDANGKELASFSQQNRVDVKLSQVPPVVIDAVLSTEDRHFFTEGAINPLSMVRAAISDLGGNGPLQGASTITQQYVKQTYLSSERTLTRKIKEAAFAIRVSRTFTKQQILQGYLNTIYWGRGAYGIQAAARTYFGVDVGQLTLPDAALLAGMIREPDVADPAVNSVVARHNMTETLQSMVRDRHITEAQAAAVAALPFSSFVKPSVAASTGAAAHLTAAPNGEDYFIEAVRQELVAKYGAEVVDGGGLRVTTTLDPTLQAAAYQAVYGRGPGSLNPAGGDPSGALVSMDDNGEVKAIVGGQNYAASQVDLALGAAGGGGGRQPGSTFKAFMLAELIKLGYSPASQFPAPIELEVPGANNGNPYIVTNFAGEAIAPKMSIVDATADSVNTVYVQVADRLGPASLDQMAAAVGIRPAELRNNLSEVLGTDEVSPLEMAAAYATFASGGVYHAPLLVTRVTDAAGHPLPLPVQPTARAVLTPAQDAELTYCLEQVVERGTGTAAALSASAVAGKTGTTDNSANAWFIGYTPSLTTAMWMGYASGFKPMVNFRGLTSVQGGTIPASIWHNYMTSALAAEPQWAGHFPPVYYLAGSVLTPPSTGSVLYPMGFATTTTSSTSTSVPPSTTSTTARATPTTRSTPKSSPPTTAAPATTTTSPPTTLAPPTTRKAAA